VSIVSPFGTRLQLFGIALVLAGGFHDLQLAIRGFTTPGSWSFGAVLVTLGLLSALAGLIGPRRSESDG